MNTKKHKTKTVVHPSSIELLTDATWQFAHNILWNGFPFGKGETEISKIFIREYYESIPAEKFQKTAAIHFSGFCERILMAKEYVSRSPHRYIPHPCIWLNRLNPKGFAGTKKWYIQLVEKRKRQQQYHSLHCECHLLFHQMHIPYFFSNHFQHRA